jgi:hypothetical protein
MIRPIFTDEIIGTHNGSLEPQYDISSGGTVQVANAAFRLLNPVTMQGTPLNSTNMNNLFDFDNVESMCGHRKTTIFNANGSITETITRIGSSVVNARRETTFPNAATIRVVTTVFADNGTTVLRQTTNNISTGASITEDVN